MTRRACAVMAISIAACGRLRFEPEALDCMAGVDCPDGCTFARPDDSREAHGYLFCEGPVTRDAARDVCAARRSALVEIESQAEDGWLIAEVAELLMIEVYTGAVDDDVEGTWRWEHGETFWTGGLGGMSQGGNYANWGANEPNDSTMADCGTIFNLAWNDVNCGALLGFVCEQP